MTAATILYKGATPKADMSLLGKRTLFAVPNRPARARSNHDRGGRGTRQLDQGRDNGGPRQQQARHPFENIGFGFDNIVLERDVKLFHLMPDFDNIVFGRNLKLFQIALSDELVVDQLGLFLGEHLRLGRS